MEFANVTVRSATPDDAAMLARLRFDLRASLHQLREDEAEFIQRCTRWMSERLNERSKWRCWIAEREGTTIGAVWVQLIEKIPNPIASPECYVYLTNFFVQPEHRGEGIGSRLLDAALSWSKSNNAELVLLWPTERSKTLYARHGFVAADDFMELVL
ncbi:MAG TPA: GNAT family N-acetyltransferase [Pyrinomonadaceae bacterium]